MLGKKVQSIYENIVVDAYEMVSKNVDKNDLTGKVNYASIYAQSLDEFHQFSKELEKNGKIIDIQPNGNYYLLNQPLITSVGNITKCRVRKPDVEHKEKGYVDFETTDFESFKKKYLTRHHFSQQQNVHGIEMVELRDPKFNVRAYFPESI